MPAPLNIRKVTWPKGEGLATRGRSATTIASTASLIGNNSNQTMVPWYLEDRVLFVHPEFHKMHANFYGKSWEVMCISLPWCWWKGVSTCYSVKIWYWTKSTTIYYPKLPLKNCKPSIFYIVPKELHQTDFVSAVVSLETSSWCFLLHHLPRIFLSMLDAFCCLSSTLGITEIRALCQSFRQWTESLEYIHTIIFY